MPLILHDEILGTFNVESPKPGAFNENDLQFLELFSREVAVALNTFELLAVEKMTTASASTERILREVASPVDEILNDAACILERYIGHEPIVSERLQRILKHTRNIKQLIQKVGETFAPRAPTCPSCRGSNGPFCGESASSWSMPTRGSAAPRTSCWAATAARSRRPTTPKRRS